MRILLLTLALCVGCATNGGSMSTRLESRFYPNNPTEDITIASSEVTIQF